MTVIANADARANVTNLVSQARPTVGAIQKTIADAWPMIVTSVSAVNSAAKATASEHT